MIDVLAPDDVAWVRLADVAEFVSGSTPSKKQPEYWGGDIRWVTAKDMKALHLQETDLHISEVAVAAGSKLAPSGSTLVLTRGMTLLKDVPICRLEREASFNQDVKALVPGPDVDHQYLTYVLLAAKPALRSMVELAGHGTGRLPTDRLKDLLIRLPGLPEQRAIARVFAALDNRIDLNRAMSTTVGTIARVLFASWFVDVNFEERSADERGLPQDLVGIFSRDLVSTELGDLPAAWSVLSLDEVARFVNGLALQKYPPSDERSLPVIKIAQLRSGQVEGADRASADLDEDYVVDDGDILFSWSGSLECKVWSAGRGALNQHLFKVTSDRYPPWLCYFAIHHHLDEFRRIAAGKATTMGHIQRHHLTEARVAVPPPEDVIVFDRLMGPLFESMWRRDKHAQTLQAIRDALLPKLMFGELAVPDAERLVEAAV